MIDYNYSLSFRFVQWRSFLVRRSRRWRGHRDDREQVELVEFQPGFVPDGNSKSVARSDKKARAFYNLFGSFLLSKQYKSVESNIECRFEISLVPVLDYIMVYVIKY